jgi:hypothetical protein
MLVSRCSILHDLSETLLEVYDLRAEAEAERHYHHVSLAEFDLARVNHLITLHRKLCRQCRFNDTVRKLPQTATNHQAKVISINRVG